MAGLLPLFIALTIVETSVHPGRTLAGAAVGGPRLLAVAAWALLLWWLLCETASRVLAARIAEARAQAGRRLLDRWDVAAQSLALGLFAGLCYGLHWPDLVDSITLALAPWALAQVLHWWCLTLPVRAFSGVPWTRRAFAWHHLRFSLLPLGLALPVLDVCFWIGNHSRVGPWLLHFGDWVNTVGASLLTVAVVALMPWLLVRAWGARPLEDGPVRGELADACARAGVRIGGILRWPVHGGRVYNAMVLGVLPRLRYVLFTDDLLRDFPARERVAVLGHELGHARHHHLWVYLLFALATGLVSWSARGPLDALLVSGIPGMQQLAEEPRAGVVALVLLALQWRVLFGYLSRLCERQADAAGAELAGDGDLRAGAATMREALGSVARLAGIDPRTPSWRHYSLHQRIAWLLRVEQDPATAARHHRRVRLVVELLAAATGVLLALAAIHVI